MIRKRRYASPVPVRTIISESVAPVLSDYLAQHPPTVTFGTTTGTSCQGNDTRLHSPHSDDQDLSNLVQKITGKGLSSEDFTTVEKNKLSGLSNYTHPDNHLPGIISQDENNRFVTDIQINSWNDKANSNHDHAGLYEAANVNIQNHIGTTHASIPLYARVTGSNATTTGQSLVTVTGLSLSLLANSVYEIEVNMTCSTTAVTSGIGYGINLSNTSGASIEAQVYGASTSSAMKTVRISAFNTSAQAFLTTSGQTGGVMIKGIIVTGSVAPILTVQHLKVTSGTSTVFVNSYVKATKL